MQAGLNREAQQKSPDTWKHVPGLMLFCGLFVSAGSAVEDQLGQLNGVDDLAVLVNAHVAGSN